MFGFEYKYQLNSEKSTIKLRPTLKGTLKAFAPVWLVLGALYALGAIAERLDKKPTEDDPQKN